MLDFRDLVETRYARSGHVNIAYQVMGSGVVDLVLVPGMISHVEEMHRIPGYTDFLARLGRFARVATFDKRGQGLSDRVAGAPTLEERSDDVRAVMDAAAMKRAVLFGVSEGTMMSVFFAAAHPERVSHLVLYGGMPRQPMAPDFPIGYPEGSAKAMFGNWGDGSFTTRYLLPSWRTEPELVKQAARFERQSCSPGNLRAFVKMNADLDVRHILAEIRVPTLVLHREDDQLVPLALGQWYGDHIPNARMIVYPGTGHWPPTFNEDWHTIVDDVEEFVTGARSSQTIEAERVLATVLFTDIVGSTKLATELGDVVWRRKLDEHDRLARRLVEQHRGRFIKGTGDGILATFDGPGRAIRCAFAMTPAFAQLQLPIRAGLHAGEIELREGDVSGISVHAAARVMDQAQAGEVLVSGVVADLVAGSGIAFSERGQCALKGLPGTWRLLAAMQ